jgi:cysteine-rich repeat protein
MRLSLILPALLLLLSACGDGNNIHRALKLDGETCLEDSECANARCLDGICRARCETDADCRNESLVCSRGGCLPRPASTCGNNVQEEGEACDDGNRKDDDGCSADCQLDPPECGNGVIESGEECDDHNKAPDDGCSPSCEIESPPPPQWVTGDWSACSATCGSGTRTRSVQCRSGADVVADYQCTESKPVTLESCSDNSGCTCSASTEILTAAASQAVTVPAGCPQLTIEAWGGGGAGGNQKGATGGGGGYATALFTVTPGETLEVQVGEGGQNPGDGGGASSVRRNSIILLIAGAGGGGASDGCSGCTSGGAGGAGGGVQGQTGLPHTYTSSLPQCVSATPGLGGADTQGGQGGSSNGYATSPNCSGADGSADAGGASNGGYTAGTCNNGGSGATAWQSGGGEGNGHGGAGGAGWYGGGGGGFIHTYCGGGGGGGSSYAHESATQVQLESGNYQQAAHPSGSSGAGTGGNVDTDWHTTDDNAGANGRVVLRWGG